MEGREGGKGEGGREGRGREGRGREVGERREGGWEGGGEGGRVGGRERRVTLLHVVVSFPREGLGMRP